MRLLLIRDTMKPGVTLGRLYASVVYTLEDEDRQLEKFPGAKIVGQTAIPRGDYPVTMEFASHFQRTLPYLHDVPNFTGIFIHAGNIPADTAGCLLVGTDRQGDAIVDSITALDAVVAIVTAAIARGEPVILEVR